MTSISKNEYIDELDDIVNKYICHSIIKKKPGNVKNNSYIDFNKKNNKEGSKFKVGDHVRISKYKNIFAKGYASNLSEEVFAIAKGKSTVPWTYVINDLSGEEIGGTFYGKEFQEPNQTDFRIGKVIKRRGNKLYVR